MQHGCFSAITCKIELSILQYFRSYLSPGGSFVALHHLINDFSRTLSLRSSPVPSPSIRSRRLITSSAIKNVMAFTKNIKTWYQITLSYRPIIKDFHTPSPIPYIKRHKSCNCTYSAEIFRYSFTPIPTHTLSLPARCRTSLINCFLSSLPAYSSQNLSTAWNLVDVGNITLVIITDTNDCAAFAVHSMDQAQMQFYAQSQKQYEFIYVLCWLSPCRSKV